MQHDELELLVQRSREGDRSALEGLLMHVRPPIYKLAQRFLMNPADAEDAAQDILLKLVTRLSQFDGHSRFMTWAYKVASNHLLDEKRRKVVHTMSFDEFGADLADGQRDPEEDIAHTNIMLAEVRIGCTLALLQCLKPEARMTYILGEILELDHTEAARVQEISEAAYRQRLSRARTAITQFMKGHCGLTEPANPCRCSKRLSRAVELGRVNPRETYLAKSEAAADAFPSVLAEVRKLESMRRAAALYRAQEEPPASDTFTHWLRTLLRDTAAVN